MNLIINGKPEQLPDGITAAQLIEQLGLADDTLVIFTSDNGMNMGHHGIYGKGNGTFPQNMYDTSVKVPALLSRPGHVPEGVVRVRVVHEDPPSPPVRHRLQPAGHGGEAAASKSRFTSLSAAEREVGQRIRLDVELGLDLSAAARSDALADTAEIQVKSRTAVLSGTQETGDLYASIGEVVDKLERQALKHKEENIGATLRKRVFL